MCLVSILILTFLWTLNNIPSSSCPANDVFVHPFIFSVVSCAYGSIMYPTSIIMSYTSDCQMTFVSNSIDAMFYGFEAREEIKLNSPINAPISNNQFLDIGEKEVDNVNKGGQRINKHAELWAKNAFDKWKVFRGFDTTSSIVDLSKDESSIKNLVDMLSSSILQVAKKDGSIYLPTK